MRFWFKLLSLKIKVCAKWININSEAKNREKTLKVLF